MEISIKTDSKSRSTLYQPPNDKNNIYDRTLRNSMKYKMNSDVEGPFDYVGT